MAEAVETSPTVLPTHAPVDKSKILCKYFQHGVCRMGESCLFSHDFSTKPNNICKFYQQGKCSYGSACRYDHIKPTPSSVLKSSSEFSPRSLASSNSLRGYLSSTASSNGASPQSSGAVSSSISHAAANSASSHSNGTDFSASSRHAAAAQNRVNDQKGDATSNSTPSRCATSSKSCAQQHRTLSALSPKCQIGDAVSNMVKLTKTKSSSVSDSSHALPACGLNASEWVKAPEFVPGQQWSSQASAVKPLSYLDVAQTGLVLPESDDSSWQTLQDGAYKADDYMSLRGSEICPYAAHGECQFGDSCLYMHGEVCDMCGLAVLSLVDMEQRAKHTEECIREHEKNMELSFAVQRSKDKQCGICMDVVWEKQPPNEQRFGILSDCSHIFCLNCIRKWRAAKQFESKLVRACPECRVKSDFVTPSKYWVDDKADKVALIDSYKKALSKKPCKHFDQGRGECPFNEKCFYLHAYPDGRIASPRSTRRRRRENADNQVDVVRQLILWDVINEISERRNSARESNATAWSSLQDLLGDDLDDYFFQFDLGLFGSNSSDEEYETDEDDDEIYVSNLTANP